MGKTISGRFFLFIFFCCMQEFSAAQGEGKDLYRIVQWDAADGLSLAYKNAMIRDVNGFLWVASPGGLNKFDGNRFQQYFYGQTAKGNMPGSYCFSIVEDSLHQLWVGTNRGLLCYNAYTDSFQSILPRTNGYADITSIVPFWASKASVFCLEQARMITCYDVRTKQRRVLSVLPENPGWKNNVAIALSVYDSLTFHSAPWCTMHGHALTDGRITTIAWKASPRTFQTTSFG
jgi:hypothetical protein